MIDGLALSCLGLRSSYLNLVSHGDKMTAPRTHMVLCTLTESVRDKVCSASVRAHVFSHTFMRQFWRQSHVVGGRSSRGHTVGLLHVPPGTAEFKISELTLFSTPRGIVSASVTYCSSTGCVPTLWSNMSLFILCGMLSLGRGIVGKFQSS